MIVNVGSKNAVKIEAVKSSFMAYDDFSAAEVRGVEVPVPPSRISEQPLGLEEIYSGAKFRALRAFNGCDYSIGLEAGLIQIPLPGEDLPRMNFTACVIYDGTGVYYGHSSGFMIPRKVAEIIEKDKVQLDQAWKRAGLTEQERIGYAKGIIHQLTNGKLSREQYICESIRMALVHLRNKDLYRQQ